MMLSNNLKRRFRAVCPSISGGEYSTLKSIEAGGPQTYLAQRTLGPRCPRCSNFLNIVVISILFNSFKEGITRGIDCYDLQDKTGVYLLMLSC